MNKRSTKIIKIERIYHLKYRCLFLKKNQFNDGMHLKNVLRII